MGRPRYTQGAERTFQFGQFVFVDRARDLVVVHRTDGPAVIRRPIDDGRVAPLLAAVFAAYPAA